MLGNLNYLFIPRKIVLSILSSFIVNDYHQENDEMFNILIYNLLYKTKKNFLF